MRRDTNMCGGEGFVREEKGIWGDAEIREERLGIEKEKDNDIEDLCDDLSDLNIESEEASL